MTDLSSLRRSAGRRASLGALLLAAGLATASIAYAPVASGQQTGVGNNGGAASSTGGNTVAGNVSGNGITSENTSTGGLLGLDGLLDVNVGLGASSNTSTGSGTVNSGSATSSGNQSGTTVEQYGSGSGGGSGFNPANPFGPPPPQQSIGITNGGEAVADSGGNQAIGNGSTNTIGATGSGSLLGVGVGLGGPTNTSTGTGTVNSGPATASGNTASNAVNQAQIGPGGGAGLGAYGGPGFAPGTVNGYGSTYDPCSNRFFPYSPVFGGPRTTVTNVGEAGAFTGDNEAVGNGSTNSITNTQTVSGGLIGVGVNLGGPTNNSSGTATINSGAANASGNQSTTSVNQFSAPCGLGNNQRNVITGNPVVVPVITPSTVKAGTLARTGFGTAALLLLAVAMMFGGSLMLGSARRRRLATVVSGHGPVSAAEWDAAARWTRGGPRAL